MIPFLRHLPLSKSWRSARLEGSLSGRYLLSILDEGHQTLKKNDVKAIVNCAAWTNVDACETDEKLAALAEKLNAEAPENLAKAMKEVDLHTHLIWLMPSSPYWIR